jgi:hypothetical protein
MVWKSTTQLGCAVQSCNGIFDSSYGVRSELFSTLSLWDHSDVEGRSLHNTMYVNTTPLVMSKGSLRELPTHYIPFAFFLSLSTAKTFRFKCRSDIALKRWIIYHCSSFIRSFEKNLRFYHSVDTSGCTRKFLSVGRYSRHSHEPGICQIFPSHRDRDLGCLFVVPGHRPRA